MKILRKAVICGLAVVGAQLSLSSAHAIPINSGSLDYEGAIFTLEAAAPVAAGSPYTITYWANFDAFTNAAQQPIFYALDWKWGGEKIDSMTLVSAPGGATNWIADISEKVNNSGSSLGCANGGGTSALCAEATSVANGVDIASAVGDLSWVFEVFFESAIDVSAVEGNTLRGGYVNASGGKAGAIMSCETALSNGICEPYEDPTIDPDPLPAPMTTLLMGIGALGLLLFRRKGAHV